MEFVHCIYQPTSELINSFLDTKVLDSLQYVPQLLLVSKDTTFAPICSLDPPTLIAENKRVCRFWQSEFIENCSVIFVVILN